MIEIILGVVIVVLLLLLFLFWKSHSNTVETINKEKSDLQLRVDQLLVESTRSGEQVESLRAKATSDRAEMETLQGSFRAEFRVMAQEILEQKGKQFKELNSESIQNLLKPFKENISDFRQRVETIYSAQNTQQGELKSEIKNLLDLNRKITQETTNLTAALKGNSKVQGDWGEMILETILQSSNLIKGIHYTTQENFKDSEGSNMRPDVVVSLPDGKQIVIDSKVSLTAFVGFSSADTHEQSERFLKEHLRSVRLHVDELGSKRYQTLVNSPDFVIMFVPSEPAFMAALQADNSIWNDAYNKKIIISSPTNLFALLKIVDDLWKRDSQSRNAIEIANEGANLYDKFMGFLETFSDLGKSIEIVSRNYEKSMNQIKTGKANLVSRAEKMKKMGLKATKNLPVGLSDFEQEQEEE